MKIFVNVVVATLCLLLLAAILFPVFARGPRGPIKSACLSHVKQASVAILIYQGEVDERYPHRDEWVDATYPYAKNWDIYHCPFDVGTPWGYAFNGALSRAKTPKYSANVPLIYDSVNPTKNASDLVESLPATPRHRHNTMSYADGHAKALPGAVVR